MGGNNDSIALVSGIWVKHTMDFLEADSLVEPCDTKRLNMDMNSSLFMSFLYVVLFD